MRRLVKDFLECDEREFLEYQKVRGMHARARREELPGGRRILYRDQKP
jgi:hypothetical protein